MSTFLWKKIGGRRFSQINAEKDIMLGVRNQLAIKLISNFLPCALDLMPCAVFIILSICVDPCPIRIFYAFKLLGLQTVFVDDKIPSACKRKPRE